MNLGNSMKIEELGIIVNFDKKDNIYKFIIYDRNIFVDNYINIYKKISDDYIWIRKAYPNITEEDADIEFLNAILKVYDTYNYLTIDINDYNKLLKITRKTRIKKMNLL